MRPDNLLLPGFALGLFGLALLVALWPGPRQGTRLLRRWGVARPDEPDVAEAVRYLRRRRFWYPWLFMFLPPVADAARLTESSSTGTWTIVVTVLLGSLLAEVLAQRPSGRGRRTAVLAERRVTDFAPRWAVALYWLAAAGGVAQLAWTGQWVRLATLAGVVLVTWSTVLLAVRRPPSGSAEVDNALRTRSARVSTGLGIAASAVLAAPNTGWITWLAGAIACVWIANPGPTTRAVSA
ncbi:hypothetical protein GCM10010185_29890 [Saccharothrix coeruleofusca]|uniref:Uncharacterized protein n=1 Tax=Saccharothrix coeruleofusca TaxID=33919 RepID=A0A918ANV8_9PSEU|nr:hypothetical protein GCM10010185_29890 [Saccharothrix coeruleofusca]